MMSVSLRLWKNKVSEKERDVKFLLIKSLCSYQADDKRMYKWGLGSCFSYTITSTYRTTAIKHTRSEIDTHWTGADRGFDCRPTKLRMAFPY